MTTCDQDMAEFERQLAIPQPRSTELAGLTRLLRLTITQQMRHIALFHCTCGRCEERYRAAKSRL